MEHLKKFNENWFKDFIDPDSREKKPEKKRVKLEDRKRKPEGMNRERYIGNSDTSVSNVKKGDSATKPATKSKSSSAKNSSKLDSFQNILVPAIRDCQRIGLVNTKMIDHNNWILIFDHYNKRIKINMQIIGDEILLKARSIRGTEFTKRIGILTHLNNTLSIRHIVDGISAFMEQNSRDL